MTVWIVFSEYSHPSDGDGAVLVGVAATKERAEQIRADEIAQQHNEFQNQVWGDESEDENFDEADWDVDVHLEEMEVLS